MAKAVGNVSVVVGGNTKPLETALSGANRMLSKFASSVPGVGGLAGAAVTGGVAGVAMAAANQLTSILSQVAASVVNQVEMLDKAAKTAAATGMDVGDFLGLGFGAQLADMTEESFGSAMMKMRKAMGQAANGTDEIIESLRMMGVEYADIRNLSPDEQLKAIADGFQKGGMNAQSLVGMLKVFGKGAGPEMAAFLAEGREGLEKYQKRAAELGLVVTAEQAKMAQEVGDAWKELKAAASGMARTFMVELLPAMQGFTEALVALAPALKIAGQATGFVAKTHPFLTFMAGSAAIRKELEEDKKKRSTPGVLPDLAASKSILPTAAEYGSSEAYKAVISALREDPAMAVQRDQLSVLQNIEANTRRAGTDGAATVGKL